jgi:hypothetical protein
MLHEPFKGRLSSPSWPPPSASSLYRQSMNDDEDHGAGIWAVRRRDEMLPKAIFILQRLLSALDGKFPPVAIKIVEP